jgi:hypothetical protein
MSDEAMCSLVKSDGDDTAIAQVVTRYIASLLTILRNLIFLLAAWSGMGGTRWLPAGDWASNRLIETRHPLDG